MGWRDFMKKPVHPPRKRDAKTDDLVQRARRAVVVLERIVIERQKEAKSLKKFVGLG